MGKKQEPFKCKHCPKKFATKTERKKHVKFYHNFSKPYICECGLQFGKLCEVKYHVRRDHNQEKNYVCDECKKSFFRKTDLVIHLETHESSAKFICEDCGRRFKHSSNLIRHSRTHTGVKPYLCLVCDQRFTQIAGLNRHQFTEKHKEKLAKGNERKKKEILNSLQMTGDVIFVDDEGNVVDETKPEADKRKGWFYCKICGERFKYSVLLRSHESEHVVNNDIKCNRCKEDFPNMEEFKNHACAFIFVEKEIKDAVDIEDITGVVVNETEVECEELDVCDEMKEEEDCQVKEDVAEDKQVELTMAKNGQILVDNDEVLLTLKDKDYGLLLVNNDVTAVENKEYIEILNASKDQAMVEDSPIVPEKQTEATQTCENIENEVNQRGSGCESPLILTENWLWPEKDLASEEFSLEGQGKIEVVAIQCAPTEECQFIDSNVGIDKKEILQQDSGVSFPKPQKYKCVECKKIFSWKSSLRNHVVNNHKKRKEYSCMLCHKIYYSSILMKHHVERDHLNMRPNKCMVCQKSFFRQYDLKVHSRIHTDERPYICGVCGKRFRHVSHIIRHDKTHKKDAVQ